MDIVLASMYTATVTGRGVIHLPAELRKRFRIAPGDKVELRPARGGILLERIPTLEEGFGAYRGDGRRWARELLEEKKAELAREERSLVVEEARIRRLARGAKVRVGHGRADALRRGGRAGPALHG